MEGDDLSIRLESVADVQRLARRRNDAKESVPPRRRHVVVREAKGRRAGLAREELRLAHSIGSDQLGVRQGGSQVLEQPWPVVLRHPGEVLSRTRIYEHVWDERYDGLSNTLEVHVMEVRRKLEAHGPRLIHTARGRGYLFGDDPGSGR